jgi:hypothetical protein
MQNESRWVAAREPLAFARPPSHSKMESLSSRLLHVGVIAMILCLAPSSCRSKKATVVVGLQSEPMGGALVSVHVVIKVDGIIARDETRVASARSPLAFPRPWEARLTAGNGGEGVVDVEVDAFDAASSANPLLRRLASTRFVPGRETLLRIRLEPRCIVYPSPPRPLGSPPGPLNGPVCNAPDTCIRGSCQSSFIPAERLEPYAPEWASHAPDMCKPKDGGSPTLQIGTGQAGYSAVTRDQVLRAEPGPQGGHHVWIAVRMQNMTQAGGTTTISAVQPGTGTPIPSSAFLFPFDPDEGGSCQLYGLRYQLDNGGIDYTQFLGKPLDVTATLVDATGATATATARIQVAAELAFDHPAAAAPTPRRADAH